MHLNFRAGISARIAREGGSGVMMRGYDGGQKIRGWKWDDNKRWRNSMGRPNGALREKILSLKKDGERGVILKKYGTSSCFFQRLAKGPTMKEPT